MARVRSASCAAREPTHPPGAARPMFVDAWNAPAPLQCLCRSCCADSAGQVLDWRTASRMVELDAELSVDAQQKECLRICAEDAKCVRAWFNDQPGTSFQWSLDDFIRENAEYCVLFEVANGPIFSERREQRGFNPFKINADAKDASLVVETVATNLISGAVIVAGAGLVVAATAVTAVVAVPVAIGAIAVLWGMSTAYAEPPSCQFQTHHQDFRDMCFTKEVRGASCALCGCMPLHAHR